MYSRNSPLICTIFLTLVCGLNGYYSYDRYSNVPEPYYSRYRYDPYRYYRPSTYSPPASVSSYGNGYERNYGNSHGRTPYASGNPYPTGNQYNYVPRSYYSSYGDSSYGRTYASSQPTSSAYSPRPYLNPPYNHRFYGESLPPTGNPYIASSSQSVATNMVSVKNNPFGDMSSNGDQSVAYPFPQQRMPKSDDEKEEAPKFLGKGLVEVNNDKAILSCFLYHPKFKMNANIDWVKITGPYDYTQRELPYVCPSTGCIYEFVSGTNETRYKVLNDQQLSFLIISHPNRADHGFYRCSAIETSEEGKNQTFYQVVKFIE